MLTKVLNILTIVLLAVGLGVCLVVGGCDMPVPTLSGSVPMKCVWGLSSVAACLAVGLILAVARLWLKTREAQRFSAVSLILVVLAAALIPSPLVVGVCSWAPTALCCADLAASGASAEALAFCGVTMDCHISAITVWIMAALVVICMVIVIATAQGSKAETETETERKPGLFDPQQR